MRLLLLACAAVTASRAEVALAQEAAAVPAESSEVAEPLPDAPVVEPEDEGGQPFVARLYGYVAANYEKSAATPARINERGATEYDESPGEWDVKNLNVMVQGNVYGKYRYFLNLGAPGSGSPIDDVSLAVKNAWLELPLYRELAILRMGKTYRRFGLYNEILDAVPTFIGIEPPEMFDGDHLMLTRTTNAMLHGKAVVRDLVVSYALATGQDERLGAAVPVSLDVRVDVPIGLRLGLSYYTTNGKAGPSHDVDGGNPIGGVANWMESDRFSVFTVFGQLVYGKLTLQAEYTRADHDAVRDPSRVARLYDEAGLNLEQRLRFFRGPGLPSADTVIRGTEYVVTAAYLRAGYERELRGWSLTPYAQLDFYRNPENIDSEDYGGDHEAGLSDDGQFLKSTLGLVARPVRFVAIKLDGSTHTQIFNGQSETYPELRISVSLYWELGDVLH